MRKTTHDAAGTSIAVDEGREARSVESGSILILAIVFLVAVSLIVLALASWTTNDLRNTTQFQNSSVRLYAADSAVSVAMRAERYTYQPRGGELCPGSTISMDDVYGLSVRVWCDVVDNVAPTVTRQVTLTACLVPSASSILTGACQVSSGTVPTLLVATVNYDDATLTSSLTNSNYNCTSVANVNCGSYMSVYSWLPQ